MVIKYHTDLEQGSPAWLAARCGLLTASEMKLILTPTLKIAQNDKKKAHFHEILSQRITGHVEPHYVSDDMLRGHVDEIQARILYAENYAPVEELGFITNDKWGFTLGYSPDGHVPPKSGIECKSRRQRFQVETILNGVMPDDYLLQVQTGLLVSEYEWIDFVSYSGGLPMVTIRVYPDREVQNAIIDAASQFEERLAIKRAEYEAQLRSGARLIPTERTAELEITI